ncbi:cysteine hydrolase family protein [Angustibacter sp. Root456]|uniref:cysteine hydrolase family protein n=1 Tax=Angustibacter sp. Root456 TaxID=1736539 RepID=UPI0006F90598|nr:isochorismatase family cysteine hydrolase [Angustibacter sp. Root456]KQX61846.1 isochorismatase [Angustibacter sp. Root456]
MREDVAHHEWSIDQREIDRHVARRGREHAYVRLDPRTTALVVVDVVPFFVEESAYVRGILPKVNRLAGALRAEGGTVAWVVPRTTAPSPVTREFFGDRVAELYSQSGGAGAPRERLWRGLDVDPADVVVDKSGPSAFFPGTCDLHDLLAARAIATLVVTGTVTNVCVESTVRDASALGYRVVLVADGCAAVRDRDHDATLHVVYRSFGDVRATDDVLALIQAGGLEPGHADVL